MPSSAHQPFPTAVQWSHLLLQPRLQPGMNAVDATAGNGHDALFLAQHVLPNGKLFIFDIQEPAITSTRQRLLDHAIPLDSVEFFQTGHQTLIQSLPPTLHGQINAIMFNLGYLPGGDKSRITLTESTLSAIRQALDMLAPDGLLTTVVYPGHDGGREEAALVETLFSQLPSDIFEVQKHAFLNYRPTTPYLMAVRRKKAEAGTPTTP
ncbi:methyltransferase domain-containing protein [Phragmitibacter flavus]|uniref:Methyltransferase domain-containing protein n=1 Tax=Phragmitibacter flavus TaxID=2576071 RepID=A0A5R8KGJ9_9BACT|nr:class I SAM-dependent methyltransferase [Phragmitibacter flavus]TLD71085.1 methyltransferase domain-containing protein [Phragmitibacter flavus]